MYYVVVDEEFGIVRRVDGEEYQTKEEAVERAKELFAVKHANGERMYINLEIVEISDDPKSNGKYVPWWN
jgi:hypothetical protein